MNLKHLAPKLDLMVRMPRSTSTSVKSLSSSARKQASAAVKKIQKVAKDSFDFTELRPGQEEAIASLLTHRDTLVVMPTGSGKSAIYQIAGLLLEGSVLVISPLIALQKDQVDSINEQECGAEAVVLNSTLRVAEARAIVEKIKQGTGKYIFLAPEQLRRAETLQALSEAQICLFVIDEAHCISEWGHDFRPDYLQLGSVVEHLGHPVVLAITATASEQVRDEIVKRLCMTSPQIFVHGFNRPNISLRVDHFESQTDKLEALIRRVSWAEKPGIVYVGTRKMAEEIMRLLAEEGVNALFYHGGLKAAEREQMQDRFMAGEADVIVATNAFGMGIDKCDIRFVYHYDISDALDSYYQEIGRAGRDGEKAEAVLFFRSEDLGAQAFKTAEGHLQQAQVEKVALAVADQEGPVAADELAERTNLSARKLTSALHRLEDVGALETLPSGEIQVVVDAADLSEAARAAVAEQEQRRNMKRERLRQMAEYADTSGCRREKLLRYFGEQFAGPCGNCDNCMGVKTAQMYDDAVGTRREVVIE